MTALLDLPASAPVLLGIGVVERDTGLSKDTLRIWERRYHFPVPGRDAFGERVYPPDQIDKLHAIKRLMDQGMRPGKLMHHSLDELRALKQPSAAPAAPASDDMDYLLTLLRQHRVDALRDALSAQVLRCGLARFIIDIVAPLNRAVGEAWATGDLAIFEEHLYTESIKGVLRHAIASVPRRGGTPRIVLTTLPREEHGLGLLMAEAVLALEGAHCVSLGVQTPVADIVRAAVSQRADIIALSFSAAYAASGAQHDLTALRAALPASTEIWAGGTALAQARRPSDDVRVLSGLESIHTALAEWRQRHPGRSAHTV